MTRKDWDKLNLQVKLGATPDFNAILYSVGWCRDCAFRKFEGCPYNKEKQSKGITIETIDKQQRHHHTLWKPCYKPETFDEEK